jgi:hypothetical protein
MKTARELTQRLRLSGSRRAGAGRVALALVAAATLAGPAAAHRRHPENPWVRESHAIGSLVDVQVLVDGNRVPLFYSSNSADRRYFEAARGRNYALELRNRTGRRVAVLIAVDGINVVNGARSKLSCTEPMYVLDAWESTTIRGWRTSLEHVQQFVFVDEERSYASRTDQANGDMGWIRVLTFEEQPRVATYSRPWGVWGAPPCGAAPDEERGAARPAPALPSPGDDERPLDAAPEAARPPAAQKPARPRAAFEGVGDAAQPNASSSDALAGHAEATRKRAAEATPGTGWGARRDDPVREVRFEPAVAATDRLVLRYEYESGLAALGIYPNEERVWKRERGEMSFARPPRW